MGSEGAEGGVNEWGGNDGIRESGKDENNGETIRDDKQNKHENLASTLYPLHFFYSHVLSACLYLKHVSFIPTINY